MNRLLIALALFMLAAVSPAAASDCWNNVAGTQTNCAQVPAFLNGSNQTVPVSSTNPLPISGAGGGGTSSNFSATFPAAGTAAGAEFLTTPPTLTNGQMVPFFTDINGNLKVNVAVGGGTGGTSSTFGAAFPATGTAVGAKNGANMVNLTADGSGNLDINCLVGCVTAAAQGSTTSGQTGPLMQGAVTAATPGYTTGTTNPLSLDLNGSLRISAATLPLPASAAIAGLQPTNAVANSTTSGQTGNLLMCASTSAAPSLIDGRTNFCSQDLSGNLRVVANAGTNLNTSLLALESGGNLASILAAVVAPITPCTTAACASGNPIGNVISNTVSATVTTPIASPGLVNWTAHGLIANTPVMFTGATLPTGLVAGTTYFVISAGLTANVFEVAATVGGAAINFTGTSSGVQTAAAINAGPLLQGIVLPDHPTYNLGQAGPVSMDVAGNIRVGAGTFTLVPVATMTVTTGSHATGTVVGIQNTTQPLQFLKVGDAGHLDTITVTSKAVVASSLEACVFRTFPSSTTFTSAVAPAINAADVNKVHGCYQLNAPNSALGTMTVWHREDMNIDFGGINSFYIILVNTGPAFTPVSTTDFNMYVTGHY